jgi:hypothetical protein
LIRAQYFAALAAVLGWMFGSLQFTERIWPVR